MKLIIEQQDAQAIADYLSGRPYKEVYNLLPPLARLQPIPEVVPIPPSSPELMVIAAQAKPKRKRRTKAEMAAARATNGAHAEA